MVVMRTWLVAALFVGLGAVSVTPTAQACHETYDGCILACPAYTETTSCDDANHSLGTVKGVVVKGKAFLDAATSGGDYKAALYAGSDGDDEGTIEFTFEWDAAASRDTVTLFIEVDGMVDFDGDTMANVTFTPSDTTETQSFHFTTDAHHHRHLPFTVRAHTASGTDESIEGVFTVGEDEHETFGPDDVIEEYWWMLLIALLIGVALAMAMRRRPRNP